jgi:hypothetical protein
MRPLPRTQRTRTMPKSAHTTPEEHLLRRQVRRNAARKARRALARDEVRGALPQEEHGTPNIHNTTPEERLLRREVRRNAARRNAARNARRALARDEVRGALPQEEHGAPNLHKEREETERRTICQDDESFNDPTSLTPLIKYLHKYISKGCSETSSTIFADTAECHRIQEAQ